MTIIPKQDKSRLYAVKRHTGETYPRENGESVSTIMTMDSSLRWNDGISVNDENIHIT